MPKATGRKLPHHSSAASLPLVLGSVAFACGGDAAGGPLPTRVKLAAWGENTARGVREKFLVNEQTAQVLASEQQRRGWDAVPGDYEHQSIPGHPNYKADPREYWARHGRVEVIAGDGLYYVPGEYTASGKQHAASYQDVSGYFFLDPKTRAVIAVKSVALCEHGQVEGAEFIQAAIIAAAMEGGMRKAEGGMADEEIMAFCKDLLDLNDDATAEDVAAGLEELVRAKSAGAPDAKISKDKTQSTKTQTAMDPEIKAALDAQNASIAALTTNLTAVAASLASIATTQTRDQHNREVEAVIAAAVAQGKKVPDALKEKDDKGCYKLAASALKPVLDVIPATEPVTFLTPDGVLPASGRFNFQPSAEAEKEVMLALGITKESWDKSIPLIHGNEPQGDLKKKLQTAN